MFVSADESCANAAAGNAKPLAAKIADTATTPPIFRRFKNLRNFMTHPKSTTT
jgi:hypothetical protein